MSEPLGPPGHPLFGHLSAIRSDVLGLVTQAAADYGDVVRLRLGTTPVFLVNDPERVRLVLQERHRVYTKETRSTSRLAMVAGESLLTSNGPWWQVQRRRLQPVFQPPCMASLQATMQGAADELVERWDKLADTGEPVDIASEMTQVTFTIAARCLFGSEISDQAGRVQENLAIMLDHVYGSLQRIVNLPLWIPAPSNLRFRSARRALDTIVYRILKERRALNSDGHNDLLSVLLAATDAETNDRMTDRQLRNETITLLLAGHETTANLLSWAWHLLGGHPEVNVDASSADQILLEAMRLYPPIWIVERRAMQADDLGGANIPRGASVVVSPYVLHRRASHWDDPDAFQPERFHDGAPPESAKRVYMPFGLGPRRCIGQHFAMLEARIVLTTLARRFRLEPVAGHLTVPEPGITLRVRDGLPMRILKRSGD